jgi:hypothetical protein
MQTFGHGMKIISFGLLISKLIFSPKFYTHNIIMFYYNADLLRYSEIILQFLIKIRGAPDNRAFWPNS